MSGIAAIYHRHGEPVDGSVLDQMLAAAPYRGRDGFGSYLRGAVALGHAMLHSTPESLRESQPLSDESGRLILTFDGRIDNRVELIAELEADSRALRSDTDAEIVLRAYQSWGDDFPRRIIGDFALVIWDAGRRRLFCARDPFGVKTFYYHLTPRLFICASELHQLFADPRVPREANEGLIGELAVKYPATLEETLFRGILRLPPRYAMTISADGVRQWRYYEPDPSVAIRYRADQEYGEHFLSIFTEAIRCRLRTHSRILADLSGGMDSSSIVCALAAMIARGETKPLLEVVSIPKTADMDDSLYVAAVERKTGLTAIKLVPTDPDLETLVEQSLHYQDLPDYPNQGMADYDSLLESREDFRVRLSGVGGDEWLTGSDSSYADDLRGLHLINILKRLRDQPVRNLLTDGISPMLPGRVRRLARKIVRPDLPHACLTADFARRIHLSDRMRLEQSGPRFPSYTQQDIYRMFTTGLRAYPCEMMERWACGRALEGRYPFLDRRIFEFALAIPEEQRARGPLTRLVVRNAMRGILPEEVRTRTDKSTYGCAFITSLEKVGGIRVFDGMKTVQLGWFDGLWLRRQYEETLRLYNASDYAYQYNVFHLWKAFAIELWYNAVFGSAVARHHNILSAAGK